MLPTKLYHYSEEPIKKLRKNFHDKHRKFFIPFGKPHAFWFSVEDFTDDINWFTWCKSEEFRPKSLDYRYLVKIKKKSNIIYLKNPAEIEEFSFRYKENVFNSKQTFKEFINSIDWDEVQKEYDGIIIAPYQWSCRLLNPITSWYYSWDCASGCIWNVNRIESLTLDPIQEEKEEIPRAESEKDSQSTVCCLPE